MPIDIKRSPRHIFKGKNDSIMLPDFFFLEKPHIQTIYFYRNTSVYMKYIEKNLEAQGQYLPNQ